MNIFSYILLGHFAHIRLPGKILLNPASSHVSLSGKFIFFMWYKVVPYGEKYTQVDPNMSQIVFVHWNLCDKLKQRSSYNYILADLLYFTIYSYPPPPTTSCKPKPN